MRQFTQLVIIQVIKSANADFSAICTEEGCDISMEKLGDLNGKLLLKERRPLTWFSGLIK